MTPNEFEGTVALVTGGAKGIGEASVRELSRMGAQVVILDTDERAGMALEADLAAGNGCLFVSGDTADEADVETAFGAARNRFGAVSILHVNAGIGVAKQLVDMSLDEWQRVIDVNLTGAFLTTRAAFREMMSAGGGAIVLTSSPHALVTTSSASPYAASKAGMLGLVRALAIEGAPHDVRVNAVLPGAVDSPMLQDHVATFADPAAELAKFAAIHPLRRLARPDEIAVAVAFLLSSSAAFITGAALPIDGGLLASMAGGIQYEKGVVDAPDVLRGR
jgi:NAD(P)-dependent dehydrogenase (short-subunit alcohol dehydrogenase family)